MTDQKWKTLDIAETIRRRNKQHEQTTSAGVGGYEVPIGRPLRRQVPVPPYKKVAEKKKKS